LVFFEKDKLWLTMTHLAPAPAPTKLQRPFSLFRDITNSYCDSLLRVGLREWGFSSKTVFILCFFIIVCGVAVLFGGQEAGAFCQCHGTRK
jgi:hypothetical protein